MMLTVYGFNKNWLMYQPLIHVIQIPYEQLLNALWCDLRSAVDYYEYKSIFEFLNNPDKDDVLEFIDDLSTSYNFRYINPKTGEESEELFTQVRALICNIINGFSILTLALGHHSLDTRLRPVINTDFIIVYNGG